MNFPTDPGPWTPEQTVEAMLDVAVRAAPEWAEKAWLVAVTARDAAPLGEANAWLNVATKSLVRDYAALCERIVADVRATPDQVNRFAHEVAAAMERRMNELKAASVHRGGTA